MVAIVAVASSLAQLIQLPDIVGAFLSGLALNAAVKEKEAKKHLEFIANSLFIPAFFITTGFLIDPRALAHSVATDLPLVLSIIGALVVGKFAAAELTGRMAIVQFVLAGVLWFFLLGWAIHLWSVLDAALWKPKS